MGRGIASIRHHSARMFRLALALFAVQSGFHGFTAALPLALARAGVPDPEIGLIVGVAALVQIPAAFLAAALVDRFGGVRLLALGGVAYLAGSGVLLLPGVEPGGSRLPFVVARLFQGAGIAMTLPAALSLVPRLFPRERRGFGLAFIGSAHNLTLVALPPLSLVVLDRTSLDGVALTIAAFVVAGLALILAAPLRFRPAGPDDHGAGDGPQHAAQRRFGFAFRREWIRPLLVAVLYVSHWGVIVAYLPQRAEAAGADIGLFFVSDGLAVLAVRTPAGWLADRVRPRLIVLAGIALTLVSAVLLLPPATTPLLVLAGAGTGAGAGLLLTPLLVEMSRRSSEADRGSAFSLFSGALATALVIGSIGVAPLVAAAGFSAALGAAILAIVAAAFVALGDRDLARDPRRGIERPHAAV